MQPMQPFGFGVGCLSVRHGDGSCNCVVSPAGAVLSQGLEELDFLRGACSAAQAGDVPRLKRILDRNPGAMHGDGAVTSTAGKGAAAGAVHGDGAVTSTAGKGAAAGALRGDGAVTSVDGRGAAAGAGQRAAETGGAAAGAALTEGANWAVPATAAAGGAGYTPLHYAARAGRLAAAELLIERGAKVDALTAAGRATPLHRAAAQGHTQVVTLLLKHGADAALQDADGETPLHKAAAAGWPEVCRLLLAAAPGAAAARDRHGLTPLQQCGEGSEAAAVLKGCEGS